MLRWTVTAAFAALVITSPAVSQQHQHARADSTAQMQRMMMGQAMGQMMGMMSMTDHEFMMRVMRFTPGNVAAHAADLDLDATQRAQLQEIQSSMQQPGQMMQMGRGMMDVLREVFDRDEVDPDAIRAAVDSLSPMWAGMHAQHFVIAARVRALLTPGQREELMLLPFSEMDMGRTAHMMHR